MTVKKNLPARISSAPISSRWASVIVKIGRQVNSSASWRNSATPPKQAPACITWFYPEIAIMQKIGEHFFTSVKTGW